MQGGLGRTSAGARALVVESFFCSIAVLVAGIGLSSCVNTGQLADLLEDRAPATIAFDSIEGPPPAVFRDFVNSLKAQAGAQQLAVAAPSEANYRLRGYLAAHDEDGKASIAWAWDVYDADWRRAFRLAGEEKAGSAGGWAAADQHVLDRIARTGMQQLTLMSAARPAPNSASPPPAPQSTASVFGWLDDWAPEASGIFRILRQAPPPPPEIAHDAARPLPPEQVPLPNGRPGPMDTPGSKFAFAQNIGDPPAPRFMER
jgi:hypothetical protein